MRQFVFAAVVCVGFILTFRVAEAADIPDESQSMTATFGNNSLDPPVPIRGDDYFTANSSTKVRAWLALVEGRHASENQRKLVRNGRYYEALGDCRYTLERFPNHPLALSLLVEIAKALDQTTKPIAFFENALRFYPQHAYTHAQYGKFLLDIGATPAAIAELKTAVELDPNLFQARAWLAEAKGSRAGANASASPDSTQRARSGATAKARGNESQ